MNQTKLEFPRSVGSAMSHRDDPTACHENADALNKSGAIPRQAKQVLDIIKRHARILPATMAEIVFAEVAGDGTCEWDAELYYKMQKRACDLDRAGKIKREDEPVKCPITGRPAHRIDLAGGATHAS